MQPHLQWIVEGNGAILDSTLSSRATDTGLVCWYVDHGWRYIYLHKSQKIIVSSTGEDLWPKSRTEKLHQWTLQVARNSQMSHGTDNQLPEKMLFICHSSKQRYIWIIFSQIKNIVICIAVWFKFSFCLPVRLIEFILTATQQLWLYRAAPERGERYIGNPLSNFYGSFTCPEDRLWYTGPPDKRPHPTDVCQ